VFEGDRASICAIRPASCMAGGPSRSSTAPQAARASRCCPPASAIRPSRPKPIFNVQFYRPPAARCEGCIVSRGRRIISTEACVKDQAGKVLAHGTRHSWFLVRVIGGRRPGMRTREREPESAYTTARGKGFWQIVGFGSPAFRCARGENPRTGALPAPVSTVQPWAVEGWALSALARLRPSKLEGEGQEPVRPRRR
jgi:hypothetical protein